MDDQQALLASLVQLNASMGGSMAQLHSGLLHHPGLSVGLAASPCFSMPGLTLQGFNNSSGHNTHQKQSGMAVYPNTPFQTLLNASHAVHNPSAKVCPRNPFTPLDCPVA